MAGIEGVPDEVTWVPDEVIGGEDCVSVSDTN